MPLYACCGSDACGYGFELLALHFDEMFGRCLAVDGVDHHLARLYDPVGFDEGVDFGRSGVVNLHSIVLAPKEHGLDDASVAYGCELRYDPLGCECRRCRAVYGPESGGDGRVEFEDVVVHAPQGFHHLGMVKACGVGEHADLGLRIVLVAQTQGVVDHTRKVGVECGLAVARECYYVERLAGLAHVAQPGLEQTCHTFARGKARGAGALGVESGLAV